jgi:hypothetical protein
MDELVQMVSQKTGLSEEQSRQAVEIVLEYLKGKLPEPIAGQLDNIVEGSEGVDLGDMASKGLGGLFGG